MIIAVAAGVGEAGGGALLAAGFGTPGAGAAATGTMIVASSMHSPNPGAGCARSHWLLSSQPQVP
jgi:uncharacterized membrane protein YphA (DoxX/SURF4 family)